MQKVKGKNPMLAYASAVEKNLEKARVDGFQFGMDLCTVAVYNVNLNGLTKAKQLKTLEAEIGRLISEFGKDLNNASVQLEPALYRIRRAMEEENESI